MLSTTQWLLSVLLLCSVSTLLLFVRTYHVKFHSNEQRMRKAVTVRVPELVQMNLIIAALNAFSVGLGLISTLRWHTRKLRRVELIISLFCAAYFEG